MLQPIIQINSVAGAAGVQLLDSLRNDWISELAVESMKES